MSIGGRAGARQRMLRRAGLIAAALVILALLLLISSHWILGIIFGIAAAVAVWVYLQARSVR
jgi:sterol desaturase/sphingolipid hydroxylase (fatty acid hydroxylase superfamily)